jgi:hypothetical protein
MLSTAYPVVRGSSSVDRPTRRRVRPAPEPRRDWNAVSGIWGNAFIHFDARVRTILDRTTMGAESASSPAAEWCIACLTDLRAAIYELHVWTLYERLPLTPDGPPIVSYLSEAYVWCGDVLDDVEVLLADLRSGSACRDSTLAEDSTAYIEDFLGPLLGRVYRSAGHGGATEPTSHPLRPLAERVHIAIVSLNWTLVAS